MAQTADQAFNALQLALRAKRETRAYDGANAALFLGANPSVDPDEQVNGMLCCLDEAGIALGKARDLLSDGACDLAAVLAAQSLMKEAAGWLS